MREKKKKKKKRVVGIEGQLQCLSQETSHSESSIIRNKIDKLEYMFSKTRCKILYYWRVYFLRE